MTSKLLSSFHPRLIAFLLILTLLLPLIPPTPIQASAPIRIEIDGVPLTMHGTAPVIIDGRTLVGVRDVFEALGFEVSWNSNSQTASLVRSYFSLSVRVGEYRFTFHDSRFTIFFDFGLEVPGRIIDGSVMLPIRALLEPMGYQLSWDGDRQVIAISTDIVARIEEINSGIANPSLHTPPVKTAPTSSTEDANVSTEPNGIPIGSFNTEP